MSAKLLLGLATALFPFLLLAASPYPQPKSFTQATNIYKKMDFDYTRTGFTDEIYRYDPSSCMDKLYLENNPKKTVTLVRIVKESRLLKKRQCGIEKICVKYNGELFKGARCCREKDEIYTAYDRDLFNIMIIRKDKKREFENPPLIAKGNIARVYLYLNAQYGLGLSFEEQSRYFKWHQLDSVDEKECEMHQKIFELQGRENPWIKSSCEILESKSSKSSQ